MKQISQNPLMMAEEKASATGIGFGPRAARPLRVLVIAPSFDILGGQAVQAVRLIEGLRGEPSLEVDFIPINPRLPGPLRHLQRIKYVRTLVTSAAYVTSLLRRVRKVDLVHAFSASYFSFVLAPTPAIFISRLYGKRVVLNYHSGEAEEHLRRWQRTAVPTMRLADAIAVQSDYLVQIFARYGLKARAIFNNLETERFHFRERRELRPIFLSNRNLETRYNVACVLRAFALIQARVPSARLIVVGDGKERQQLEELARSLNLRDVDFRGLIAPEKMPDVYDEADIFLNASEVDSQPVSILETFASGLPAVTTDAGGIPFIVTHEKTGLLVARNDHEALAREALRLLDDNAFAFSLASNARAECKRYSWPAVRDEWLKLYREVMSGGPVAAPEEKADQPLRGAEQRATKVEREIVRS